MLTLSLQALRLFVRLAPVASSGTGGTLPKGLGWLGEERSDRYIIVHHVCYTLTGEAGEGNFGPLPDVGYTFEWLKLAIQVPALERWINLETLIMDWCDLLNHLTLSMPRLRKISLRHCKMLTLVRPTPLNDAHIQRCTLVKEAFCLLFSFKGC